MKFESKEKFVEMKKSWKEFANQEEPWLNFEHYILYAILQGKEIEGCYSNGLRDETWNGAKWKFGRASELGSWMYEQLKKPFGDIDKELFDKAIRTANNHFKEVK